MKFRITIAFLAVALGFADDAVCQTLEWARQFGGSSTDWNQDVSADGLGNVYVAGRANIFLTGSHEYISKYDSNGALTWTQQLADFFTAWGISANGLGSIYVSGYTSLNSGDAILAKYDVNGTLAWTRQLGSDWDDYGYAVAADGLGNVYIGGQTYGSVGGPYLGAGDGFLARYDANGSLDWARQIGTTNNDIVSGLATDGFGNVYVTGGTQGSLGGPHTGDHNDAFLAKYDADGSQAWIRQLGTNENDHGHDVAVDGSGNVYVSGGTNGSLAGSNAGSSDAFLAKYDTEGSFAWVRQFGTNSDDAGEGISTDGPGNVYASGRTSGSLGGVNAGSGDVYLAKFDANGSPAWTRQFGTTSNEYFGGVAADESGAVYVAGQTRGSLGGLNAGGWDAFLAKFNNSVPDSDFNDDGQIDCADIDGLVAAIAAGTHNGTFDITGDLIVDLLDLDEWRVQGGAANLPSGNPYLVGDANLDGTVDGQDYVIWNDRKFTNSAAWCSGDFTADGVVDGQDFIKWNIHKFMSSDSLTAVPEPGTFAALVAATTWLAMVRRRLLAIPSKVLATSATVIRSG